MEQPTNGELNIMIKNVSDKVDRLGEYTKSENKSNSDKLDTILSIVSETKEETRQHRAEIDNLTIVQKNHGEEIYNLNKQKNYQWGLMTAITFGIGLIIFSIQMMVQDKVNKAVLNSNYIANQVVSQIQSVANINQK